MNTIESINNIVQKQREYFLSNETKSIDFRLKQLKKLKHAVEKYSDDIYFNQSCEILIDSAEYDKDDYLVINSFTLDALCLLGKSDNPRENVTPCFASCRVERLKDFSMGNTEAFKDEFSLLMQELKTFALENKSKMEESKDMTEKVFELLSAITFKCNDADVAKYAILSISDTEANVIDKEDGYKAYSIPYSITEGDEPEITLDLDGKVEKSVGVMDKTEDDFSIKDLDDKEILFKDFNNSDLMQELQKQDKEYFETILIQNEEILNLLRKEVNNGK